MTVFAHSYRQNTDDTNRCTDESELVRLAKVEPCASPT